METRAGTHSGCGVIPVSNRTPSLASRSSDGVSIPISEYILNADHFIWSAMMNITFGYFVLLIWKVATFFWIVGINI